MPPLEGASAWINSSPLDAGDLRGRVVLVNFWTYSCINCLRALPYVREWNTRYQAEGLVVIGVHAPEFAFEKDEANVRNAVHDLKLSYPIAVDSNFAIWKAFDNQYWPTLYVADAQGIIRHQQFGEGGYEATEQAIQKLLRRAGTPAAEQEPASSSSLVNDALGAQAPSDPANLRSPETYLGYGQGARFVSSAAIARDTARRYDLNVSLRPDQWSMKGEWTVREDRVSLESPHGRIAYRFHARDLHLVMAPGADHRPIAFRVLVDGQSPGLRHGVDVDSMGYGTIGAARLYQLIRQPLPVSDHLFEIEFLDGGAQAFVFTFG